MRPRWRGSAVEILACSNITAPGSQSSDSGGKGGGSRSGYASPGWSAPLSLQDGECFQLQSITALSAEAKGTFMDIEMRWIGRRVTYGLHIFLWRWGWLMLCLVWLKTQPSRFRSSLQRADRVSTLFKKKKKKKKKKPEPRKPLCPTLEAYRHRQGEEEEEEEERVLVGGQNSWNWAPLSGRECWNFPSTQITPYFPSSSSFPALLALFLLLLLLLLLLLPAGCCCTSEALMGRADRMDKQVNCWMRTHTHPHTHKHTHTHLCAQRNTLLHYISNTH